MFRYGSSVCIAVATAAMAGGAVGAATITTASGVDAAAIQSTVDSFRSSLGTLNPNVAGSLGSGRREINWDGVPDALSAPNNLPANFFNSNSPRGVVFSTPGGGFPLSTNAGIAPVDFGNINAAYPAGTKTSTSTILLPSVDFGSALVSRVRITNGNGIAT